MMTGVSAMPKSLNVRPVAEPIMMFGGSPISVAVPPMFDAKICAKRYGYGLTLSSSVMSSVTGTVSSTVVTLSRNAENTAVTIDIISRMPHGPRVDLLRRPDRDVLEQAGAARDVDDQHHPEQEARAC